MLSLLPLLPLALSHAAHADGVMAAFHNAISRVESMVWDGGVQQMVADHGLTAVNVTWEDTGRTKNSVWGPNISDMTIGVRDSAGALHPMPVIRFANFSDRTGDIDPDNFWLRVGNEDGRSLHNVSLSSVLRNPRSYLHDASSWTGSRSSLWSSRDSEVLVSAQACFLPIPRYGDATFTPVLYNYQSSPGNPAVMTIVATREGTSMQVVENEGGYLSEPLYFNDDGDRAPFVAQRLSDFRASGGDALTPGWAAKEDAGLDVVLLIQVPLKQRVVTRNDQEYDDAPVAQAAPAPYASGAAEKSMSRRSDVEATVIGHGDAEGPYREIDGLSIERDTRFPVRVTVQFYQATSNGVVTDDDIAQIRHQIDRVYASADWVGSLVTDGYTGRRTESSPPQPPPPPRHADDATWTAPSWSWLKPY